MAKKSSEPKSIPNTIEVIKAVEASFKLTAQSIKIAVKNVDFIKTIDVNEFIKNAENVERASDAVQKCMSGVQSLISTINDVNDKLSLRKVIRFRMKLRRLKKEMNWVLKKFEDLGDVGKDRHIDPKDVADKTSKIKNIFDDLKDIVDVINNFKFKGSTFKMRRIRKALKSVQKVLDVIKHIRVTKQMEKKMVMLRTIIASLGHVIASLILLTPIMIIFILISPIILICFWAFAKIIYFLSKFMRKLISGRILLGFVVLGLVIGLLIGAALMLLLLTVMVKPLIKNYLNLLLFMGLLLGISLALAGIGLVASITLPYLLVAMIYITILTVTVGLILALALMLLLLQNIKLDAAKIKKTVKQVFDVALYIIRQIFETDTDEKSQKSNKGWIGAVLENFLTGIVSIIGAILAVAYLALIFVSIALILAISAMLLLLQNIKIDTEKIKKNVQQIFDISLYLIRNIFEQNDDKNTEETKKSWIKAVLENFLTGIVSIIGAILAVAYLALILVSVALILAIATMLRLLQELDLNESKITSNVDTVISTAHHIIDTIFDRKDDKDNPSKKSWIRKALEWLGFGPLLQILDAVMAIAYVALTFVCVSMLLALAGVLKAIENLNLNSDTIKAKVDDVMGAANKVVDEICSDEHKMKRHDNVKVNFFVAALFGREAAEQIAIMGRLNNYIASSQALKKLAEVLAKINEYPEMNGVGAKVKTIINAAKHVEGVIFDNNSEPVDWNVNARINSAVSQMSGLGKDSGEYSELLLMAKAVGGDFLTFVVSTALLSKLSDVILSINYFPKLDDVGGKVTHILNAGKAVVDALFGPDHVSVINEKQADAIEDAMDVLEDLEGNGGEYSELFILAMAVGGDFLTYVVSTALLSKLADCINKIYYLPDLEGIDVQVSHILTAGKAVVDALFGPNHVSVISDKQKDAIEDAMDVLEDLEGNGGEYSELLVMAMAVGGDFSLYVVSTALLSKLAACINTIYSFPELTGIDSKVALIMNAGEQVVKAIFGENKELTGITKNDKKNLEKALDAIKDLEGNGGEYGPLLAMAMAVGGNFALYVTATALLAQLASCINTINEFPAITNVEEQQKSLNDKVDAIINTAKYIVGAVLGEVKNKDSNYSLTDIARIKNILQGYFTTIDGISKLCNGLKSINELPELTDIEEKVKSIVASAKSVSNIITSNDPEQQLPNLNTTQVDKAKNTLSAYENIIEQISKLTKSLEGINKFSANNKIEENMKSIVKATYAVVTAFETPDESGTTPNPDQLLKRLEPMQKAFDDVSKFNNELDSEKAKVVSKSYVDFITSVNNMKIDQFKNMVEIMKDMTANSEKINENFTKLAETLEEKVVPSLTSIKSTMEETGNKIDQNGKDNIQALNDVSQGGAVSPELLSKKGFSQNTQNQAAKTRLDKVKKDRRTTNNWDTLLYLLSDDGVKIAH